MNKKKGDNSSYRVSAVSVPNEMEEAIEMGEHF